MLQLLNDICVEPNGWASLLSDHSFMHGRLSMLKTKFDTGIVSLRDALVALNIKHAFEPSTWC
jgi:hypothetical protein